MKKIVSLLLIFFLFTSLSGKSWAQYDDERERYLPSERKSPQEEVGVTISQEENPYKVGLMSIFPGMGQFYNKKKVKGFVMLGLYTLSLITVFIFHVKYDDAYKKYGNLGPGEDLEEYSKWYNEANDSYKTRNSLFLMTFTIMGISMLDAFLDAKKINEISLAKAKAEAKEREEARRMKLATMKREKPISETASSRYEEYKKMYQYEEYPYTEKSRLKNLYSSLSSDPYSEIQEGYSILDKKLQPEDFKEPSQRLVTKEFAETEELKKSYLPYFREEHFKYQSGTVISSIKLSTSSPSGLAFDGSDLWYSDFIERKIYKIDPITGLQKRSFSSGGSYPAGLAFDGKYLWNADKKEHKIYKIDNLTGSVISEIPAPSRWVCGLTYDGKALWCCDEVANTIYRINPKDGVVLHQIPSPENETYSIAWDGKYLWCIDYYQDYIHKIDPLDGKIMAAFPAPTSQGRGIVFDGFYLWCLGADEKAIFRIVP